MSTRTTQAWRTHHSALWTKLRRLFLRCFSAALLPWAVVGPSQAAVLHQAKLIYLLQPPPFNAACFYFQLQGVSTADPLTNGNPWFAVHESHPGYRQIYATLLAAKLNQLPINVTTTGAIAHTSCGSYVGVGDIHIY